MIRIPAISLIRVIPKEPERASFSLHCLGGHAKWARELGTLTLTANVTDLDVTAESSLDFLSSKQSCFDLEVGYLRGMSSEDMIVTRFFHCTQAEIEVRSGTDRPNGRTTTRCDMTIRAEECVPPNSR